MSHFFVLSFIVQLQQFLHTLGFTKRRSVADALGIADYGTIFQGAILGNEAH